MQKVLVAGATGYLGRFVVQAFKQKGYWVRALARKPEKLEQTGQFLDPAVKADVDEVFVGEVTHPETLDGCCEGIDIVFSSIGITRQRDKVSFMQVDYQGNKNLLVQAKQAGVKKFVFVSVFKADIISNLAAARELFVADLKQSGLDYAVVRPTGYFSDMSETFKMAQSGRVYLLGSGQNKINPIHGADLADVCVSAASGKEQDIAVGGPHTYTHQGIAELAFAVLGKTPKISKIPIWTVNLALKFLRPFSSHYHTIGSFFATVMQNDFDAPKSGQHSLKDYYDALASQ